MQRHVETRGYIPVRPCAEPCTCTCTHRWAWQERRRQTPRNLDRTLHPARSCLLRVTLRDTSRCNGLDAAAVSSQHSSCEFSPPTDTTSRLSSFASSPFSFLSPSSYRPLSHSSARKNGRQAKIRRWRSQGGEKIGTIGRYPIPSILFRFPGETGKGKVTKEMHLGRDSLGEKNRVRSTRSTFFLYNCLSLKISSDNEISLNY